MKTLSVLQPWASLIVRGAKHFEVRRWQTSYRGDLLIHSSKRMPGQREREQFEQSDYFKSFTPSMDLLSYGAIIGQVTLTEILPTAEALVRMNEFGYNAQQELTFDDFGPDRFAWHFSEPVEFETISPMQGTLGLWEYTGLL